jgi:hypothetical protein
LLSRGYVAEDLASCFLAGMLRRIWLFAFLSRRWVSNGFWVLDSGVGSLGYGSRLMGIRVWCMRLYAKVLFTDMQCRIEVENSEVVFWELHNPTFRSTDPPGVSESVLAKING